MNLIPNGTPTIEVLSTFRPRVVISDNALAKMFYIIKNADKEVGWLCNVDELGNDLFVIQDVFLFKQQVHSTTCEITAEGLTEFAEELLQRPDGMDIYNSIRCWGHSHVNMEVSPSGQDDKQMLEFENCGHKFFIRLIGNKHGKLRCDFYDFEKKIVFKNVQWERHIVYEDGLEEQLIAEMKEKVTEIVYTPQYTNYNGKQWDYRTGKWVQTPTYTQGKLTDMGTRIDLSKVKSSIDMFNLGFDAEDLIELGQESSYANFKKDIEIAFNLLDISPNCPTKREYETIWQICKDFFNMYSNLSL